RLLGSFFGDEVPGRDRTAGDVVGPGFPDLERLVPSGDGTGSTPERERRAGDPPSAPVGFVVLVVERGRGPVLLADRMDPRGSTELGDVLGADLGGEQSHGAR